MKKNKKYRLKKEVLMIINLFLMITSFNFTEKTIVNDIIITFIYSIIFYNCNIIYKRMLKENK